MVKKTKVVLMLAMVAGMSLSACSNDPVPDDQRVISEEEKKTAVNAADPNITPIEIDPSPVMGEGLVEEVAVEEIPVVDNGVEVILPGATPVEVEPHEVINFYASELAPNATYEAVVYYSNNGKNDKTIDLGSFPTGSATQISDKVTLPANIAPGEYMMALEYEDTIYSTPITVTK